MQESGYSELSGLSKAMAKRFQIIEDAINRGTLEEPKTNLWNTYLWYAKFKREDKRRTFGVNFSWGAFWLGVFWYVHFGLIKEAFLITFILQLIFGLLPPDINYSGGGLSVVFALYFTGTRYAKYKLTGSLSPGGNIFLTILITIGIVIITIIPSILINVILYGWE